MYIWSIQKNKNVVRYSYQRRGIMEIHGDGLKADILREIIKKYDLKQIERVTLEQVIDDLDEISILKEEN